MNRNINSAIRMRFEISGQVQGVGFRPFVYKLSKKSGLVGFVANNPKGAIIEVEGAKSTIESFRKKLLEDLPPLARITNIRVAELDVRNDDDFIILSSDVEGQAEADVTVDVAICSDCLREMFDPNNRRFRYAFINCTNCGPRYTIVRNVPYDRCNTTMSKFRMCEECRSEYENPSDRRFHAQPIACPVCGPKLYLQDKVGKVIDEEPIKTVVQYLQEGKIVAIKGIGGFHLAVNACDDEAVRRLRRLKRRERKPFAIMLANMEAIERICIVDEQSKLLLEDISRPIVLLERRGDVDEIANEVAPGLNRLGVMLPYAPQQYLLFSEGLGPVVMTSANFSEEPIISDNDEALAKLNGVVDLFLMHDRDIYRKLDDSVVQSRENNQLIMLRRARGFVPQSFELGYKSKPIIAVGAELKNTVAVSKGERVIVSEHIGDLKELTAFEHFRGVISHLCRLYEVKPEIIVADMHDDYLSSRYAMEKFDLELMRVQHHHAHVVSCMLEHNITEKVLGISADGVGIGIDGAIWGCELMIADRENFERLGHLEYFGLPGGDASAKQTFRPALALLYLAFGAESEALPVAKRICSDSQTRKMIFEMLKKGINTPMTSSLGRLFDAVASFVGIASQNYYEGQAPMMLEAVAKGISDEQYIFELRENGGGIVIDVREMIKRIINDVEASVDVCIIADKFHNTVSEFLVSAAERIAGRFGVEKVVLSGGCFANRRLSLLVERKLVGKGLQCYQHKLLPCGDGGISAGQLAIASWHFREK